MHCTMAEPCASTSHIYWPLTWRSRVRSIASSRVRPPARQTIKWNANSYLIFVFLIKIIIVCMWSTLVRDWINKIKRENIHFFSLRFFQLFLCSFAVIILFICCAYILQLQFATPSFVDEFGACLHIAPEPYDPRFDWLIYAQNHSTVFHAFQAHARSRPPAYPTHTRSFALAHCGHFNFTINWRKTYFILCYMSIAIEVTPTTNGLILHKNRQCHY